MGWTPRDRSRAGTKREASELAARVAAANPQPKILLFRLDEELDLQLLRVQLAADLAAFGLSAAVSVAGPDRVRSVLSGALDKDQVLVVVARSDEAAQDRLMDLVEWLVANGREHTASHLVFVPVGAPRKARGSFPFRHVPLASLPGGARARGGVPLKWRTAAETDQLVLAVLDQALGLA